MNGAPGQIQTTPLLTLNEGHGEEEDDEQEGYAPRPMDGTLGVSSARAEQFGQDAMALPPNVIHLRLLVGVGGVCCVVVCCIVRHCYCYCFYFCWTSRFSMQVRPVGRSRLQCRPFIQAFALAVLSLWSRCVILPLFSKARPAGASFFIILRPIAALCRYYVVPRVGLILPFKLHERWLTSRGTAIGARDSLLCMFHFCVLLHI